MSGPLTIEISRLIALLDADADHEGAHEAARLLRLDPRTTFEAHELNPANLRDIMSVRDEHLRSLGLEFAGFDDLVASLHAWDGHLQGVHVADASDADIAIYADLDAGRLAGCLVTSPAWKPPPGDPYPAILQPRPTPPWLRPRRIGNSDDRT
jgi:hypothetical protein